MGMFDAPKPFEDHFNEGDTFELEGAKLGAIMSTRFGDTQQVLFKIDGEVYSAMGAGFAGQAQRAERGDFPVTVEYTSQPAKKKGNNPTKLLWPVGLPKPWEQDAAGATPPGDTGDIPF